jgi:hypothetical protein
VFQYEPYYIARSGMPPFNSVFKGRGGNKSQHVYALYAAGYRFIVMPQVRARRLGLRLDAGPCDPRTRRHCDDAVR